MTKLMNTYDNYLNEYNVTDELSDDFIYSHYAEYIESLNNNLLYESKLLLSQSMRK